MWMDLILSVKGLKSKNWGLPEKKKFCLKTAGSNHLYSNKFFFLKLQDQFLAEFPACPTDCRLSSLHNCTVHLFSSVWLFVTPWTAVDLMDHYSFSKSLYMYIHILHTHTRTHTYTHTHFGPHCEAYRTLILQPGIKSGPLALGTQSCSLSQWTTREASLPLAPTSASPCHTHTLKNWFYFSEGPWLIQWGK